MSALEMDKIHLIRNQMLALENEPQSRGRLDALKAQLELVLHYCWLRDFIEETL